MNNAELTSEEKEVIEQVLRYRRNTLFKMVHQDPRLHKSVTDYVLIEASILQKLGLEKPH